MIVSSLIMGSFFQLMSGGRWVNNCCDVDDGSGYYWVTHCCDVDDNGQLLASDESGSLGERSRWW